MTTHTMQTKTQTQIVSDAVPIGDQNAVKSDDWSASDSDAKPEQSR